MAPGIKGKDGLLLAGGFFIAGFGDYWIPSFDGMTAMTLIQSLLRTTGL